MGLIQSAAPIVSGIAGLMRSANPGLEATVHHLPALAGKFQHARIVNAEAVVRWALDPILPCLHK
ncbi:MAG: hypothetical protein ACK5P7_01540 [Bdellovibrio sp.]